MAQVWKSVIPALWKAEAGGPQLLAQLGQLSHLARPCLKEKGLPSLFPKNRGHGATELMNRCPHRDQGSGWAHSLNCSSHFQGKVESTDHWRLQLPEGWAATPRPLQLRPRRFLIGFPGAGIRWEVAMELRPGFVLFSASVDGVGGTSLGLRRPRLPRGSGVTLHRAPRGGRVATTHKLPSWRAPLVCLPWPGYEPAPQLPRHGGCSVFWLHFRRVWPSLRAVLDHGGWGSPSRYHLGRGVSRRW